MNTSPIKSFLNQPYGLFESKATRLILSLGIAGFVWFVLFSFAIFDLSYFSVLQRFYVTGIYSLAELLTLLFNSFIIYKHVVKKTTYLTTGCWILWLIFCIGVSNFFVTSSVFRFEEFTWFVFIKNQIYTLILGLIIVPFGMLIHYIFVLKQKILHFETKTAEHSDRSPEPAENELVLLKSEYINDSFQIGLNRILFIKSADNYIDVYYTNDEKVCHKLVRNSLTAIEQTRVHPDLARCHRSYIVNRRRIQSIEGNSYGYSLSLDGFTQKIPLSRKHKRDFVRPQE
jgi:hypothetical protein